MADPPLPGPVHSMLKGGGLSLFPHSPGPGADSAAVAFWRAFSK